MYRAPSPPPRRFSIEEQLRSAAKSHLILAYLLVIANLALAGWLFADHLGFVMRFLRSLDTIYLRSEVVFTLLAWAALPLSIAYLARASRRARRGEVPKLWARLARYGDPANVAAEIEREVNAEAEAELIGSVSVTRSWLVHQHVFGFDALPLVDVVWAHAVMNTYKVNGVQVGRTRGVDIHARSEASGAPSISIPCTEEEGARLLLILTKRLPWIWLGHTPALADRWASQRAAMIAEADQRRLSSGSASA